MGVIHKLRAEVRDFILEQKKTAPKLSCRNFPTVIEGRFQIRVSKSSINSLIKQAGLSMPVGRRPKKEKKETVEAISRLSLRGLQSSPKQSLEIASSFDKSSGRSPERSRRASLANGKQGLARNDDGALPLQTTGAIMLKAADCLIGGSCSIAQAVRGNGVRTIFHQRNKGMKNSSDPISLAKTESLIYLPLFKQASQEQSSEFPELSALVGRKVDLSAILSYLEELQSVKELPAQIGQIISKATSGVRCIRIGFVDGKEAFLDAQMRTIWPSSNVPNDFCSTLYSVKNCIDRCCNNGEPFILFKAPDSHIPQPQQIRSLTLYNNKLEEVQNVSLEETGLPIFIFGLWPWQFAGSRKLKRIGEFKLFNLEALNKALYIAEVELEFTQPVVSQPVTLKGCALKASLGDKTRLVIVNSSPSSNKIAPEQLAKLYLNCWPEPQASYEDFSRKSEFFSYRVNSQTLKRGHCEEAAKAISRLSLRGLQSSPKQSLEIASSFDKSSGRSPERSRRASLANGKQGLARNDKEEGQSGLAMTSPEAKSLFENYLMLLDSYVKAYFLPSEYKSKAFATVNERFYALKASLNKQDNHTCITFQTPQGYPFLKEIEYACQRLNEAKIVLEDGKRAWFLV